MAEVMRPSTPEPDQTVEEAPSFPVSPDHGDGVEYFDSGRIRLRAGGQDYMLRPPLFGEFKAYRMALAEVDDAVARATSSAEGIEAFQDGIFDVVKSLVKTLTGRTFPDTRDELPLWLGSPNLTRNLTTHWQTVPLLSGVPGLM